MTTPKRLYLLTGCTAAGKTAAALVWAERHKAEIVSCDSLLFYRGMDLGTAKPTLDERARVPHHLIDVLEVTERIDVRDYVVRARAAITAIATRGRPVLVVGGSGFYLRSFVGPVTDDVAITPQLRSEVECALAADGLTGLVRRLEGLNPRGLAGLDTDNPRRVVRALERCLATGRTLVELREAFRRQAGPFADYEVHLVEVAREEHDLRARILTRARAMLDQGLIEEVVALRMRGLEQNPSAARAIGYRETLAWLDADARDPAVLTAEIATHTWQLVRKQRTWLRTQLPAHRVIQLAPGEDLPAGDLFSL